VYTILTTDPVAAGSVGYAMFYVTCFAAVAGSASLTGAIVRRRWTAREHALRISLRQGVLVGLGVVVAVFLQARQLLGWVNFGFLVIALTLLELFLISLHRERGVVPPVGLV